MAAKRGLGKGIDAMISGDDTKAKKVVKEIIKEVDTIDINKIEPNSNQPRKNFNEDKIHELAESIKQHGLIEPLIVQKGKKGFYTIIAGERRWRAAREAGVKEIPVVVKEYSDQQVMEIALIENIQRENLNAIEEAEAYERLIKDFNLKQDEVAERVSKSRVAITNSLRLLKLDPRVREMIIEDKIKSGHARALLSVTDQEEQYRLAVMIFDNSMSVRETEKMVKKYLADKDKPTKEVKKKDTQTELIYKDYEEKLKTVIGTKVNINNKGKGKGKIEIEYFSPEDLERSSGRMMSMR
ncbi:ParB/RepB/Spo0J family partition protein [Jutongia huaianensis]|uniref:ParB/RepB/Spo0J family partition protein n=1 Tax=Jutongia huaianensis TaxID=2763668 RepID=A0ABR7N4R0_9FIRM|nr:ParB/RepB/Spo0J family partition protein [Jutongia huaianensis]MBC8563609.1 ParB/RepB/Spo0J family partition protein [Jutongia huaianensis]